jgi:hypothetical protein
MVLALAFFQLFFLKNDLHKILYKTVGLDGLIRALNYSNKFMKEDKF